jgi:hypothetical protein
MVEPGQDLLIDKPLTIKILVLFRSLDHQHWPNVYFAEQGLSANREPVVDENRYQQKSHPEQWVGMAF